MDSLAISLADGAQRVAALVVVSDGRIVLERYGFGNDQDTLWISSSMAKSPLHPEQRGDPGRLYRRARRPVTKYLPVLKGSGFDGCILRDLLRMSSGVRCVNHMNRLAAARTRDDRLLPFLASLPRAEPPGKGFAYRPAKRRS
jgi:CubicO group peptidase (beta-lactamase class C family)